MRFPADNLAAIQIKHQIATQKTRIAAEQLGWQHRKPAPAPSLMRIGLPKKPMAALSLASFIHTLELERKKMSEFVGDFSGKIGGVEIHSIPCKRAYWSELK